MTDGHEVWLTPPEAAQRAKVSSTTLLRAARRGTLRGYKVADGRLWRFKPEDVDAWVQRLSHPVLVGGRHAQ